MSTAQGRIKDIRRGPTTAIHNATQNATQARHDKKQVAGGLPNQPVGASTIGRPFAHLLGEISSCWFDAVPVVMIQWDSEGDGDAVG